MSILRFFVVGDRVTVNIRDRSGWVSAAADKLQGMTGTVERVHETNGGVLVRFDRSCPKWWRWQSEVKAFWLEPRELDLESEKVSS